MCESGGNNRCHWAAGTIGQSTPGALKSVHATKLLNIEPVFDMHVNERDIRYVVREFQNIGARLPCSV